MTEIQKIFKEEVIPDELNTLIEYVLAGAAPEWSVTCWTPEQIMSELLTASRNWKDTPWARGYCDALRNILIFSKEELA